MKAIITKYLPVTEQRGSRIKACDSDGNYVTIQYPFELTVSQAHLKAAVALRDKMGWTGELIGGATKTGYAFVFTDSEPRTKEV